MLLTPCPDLPQRATNYSAMTRLLRTILYDLEAPHLTQQRLVPQRAGRPAHETEAWDVHGAHQVVISMEGALPSPRFAGTLPLHMSAHNQAPDMVTHLPPLS